MPAANLLSDDGSLGVVVDPGSRSALKAGGHDVGTMANGSGGSDYCNVHVALILLLGVGLVLMFRKSGIHAIHLEG
jgi:hypothetical protein